MIEQFWTGQFVIVIAEFTYPINPPEKEKGEFEVIKEFWTEQLIIVVAELAYPINPPEKDEKE